jgi:hypothetical protein
LQMPVVVHGHKQAHEPQEGAGRASHPLLNGLNAQRGYRYPPTAPHNPNFRGHHRNMAAVPVPWALLPVGSACPAGRHFAFGD